MSVRGIKKESYRNPSRFFRERKKAFQTFQSFPYLSTRVPFYCITFELGVGHFGRILTNNKLSDVDFADLFDNPWDEYEQGGFNRVWISRLDGKPISGKECKALYQLVTDDMYFDYPEEEVVVNVDKTELADTVIVTAFEI